MPQRHLDEEGRINFIRLMWEVCYADGELHGQHALAGRRAGRVGSRERALGARQAAQRGSSSKSVN